MTLNLATHFTCTLHYVFSDIMMLALKLKLSRKDSQPVNPFFLFQASLEPEKQKLPKLL